MIRAAAGFGSAHCPRSYEWLRAQRNLSFGLLIYSVGQCQAVVQRVTRPRLCIFLAMLVSFDDLLLGPLVQRIDISLL